jgi:hypothetical protein
MHSLHVGHMMLSATAMATLRANEPSTHGGLGPGAGAWKHEPAEAHGMSAEALERAAADLAELLPVRYCLLVAHDGAIVHESYEHNSSETLYSLDSAMKLGTAALVRRSLSPPTVPTARRLAWGSLRGSQAGRPRRGLLAACLKGRTAHAMFVPVHPRAASNGGAVLARDVARQPCSAPLAGFLG